MTWGFTSLQYITAVETTKKQQDGAVVHVDSVHLIKFLQLLVQLMGLQAPPNSYLYSSSIGCNLITRMLYDPQKTVAAKNFTMYCICYHVDYVSFLHYYFYLTNFTGI